MQAYIEAVVYIDQGFHLLVQELAGAVNGTNVQPADTMVDNLLPLSCTISTILNKQQKQ